MRMPPHAFFLGLALCAAPPAPMVGRPCLFSTYFAEWRCFPAILRDSVGNLTCGKYLLNNGGMTQAPLAAGDPEATPMPAESPQEPRFYFTYRDRDGGLQALWFSRSREHDEWHYLQLTQGGATGAPPAAGDPSTFEAGGIFHATYRDWSGDIVDLANPGHWTFTRLNVKDAPQAAGDPVQVLHKGIRHIVYRDQEGGLQDLRCEGRWKAQRLNLGGALAVPAALGQAALLADTDALHVVYRDATGNLWDLTNDGNWHAQRLNRGGATQAPMAAGDPAVARVQGAWHVTYRDPEGRIEDLWFDGAWHRETLNAPGATDAPRAAGDPVTRVPPSLWFLVSYVDVHGQAQLLTHEPGRPWRSAPILPEGNPLR